LVQSSVGEDRKTKLWQNWQTLQSSLNGLPGTPATLPASHRSAIFPIIIGDETKAVEAAIGLRKKGIFIPAVRYPTVARGKARLRLTITASHSNQDINSLLEALTSLEINLHAQD
jgi:7-keto-8-aminopelargonate synthetase-like enzyme